MGNFGQQEEMMIRQNRITTVLTLAAVTMAIVVLTTSSTQANEAQLISALNALKDHVDGTTPLNANQIETHKLTIDANSGIFENSAATITKSFDLVQAYETNIGPMWSAGSPTQNGYSRRDMSDGDIHWAMFHVMQYIVDDTYNSGNIATHQGLLNGYQFGSADVFPGQVSGPTAAHTVSIDGSFLNTYGHDTMHWTDRPARKATGAYLAPGSIATITVPQSLVNQGYQVRVGGNAWDFSNKNPVDRLDRVSLAYDINSTSIQVASPLGGNIYIDVPFEADAGVVDIDIQNTVRSPFFSMQDHNTTSLAEWQNTERNHQAPWTDFQSEKFMMHVPTGWVYALNDPETLMQNWEKAVDETNDLMGFPHDRGKETLYNQVDVRIRAGAYSPGYPQVNNTYDPLRNNDSSDYNNAGNAYTGNNGNYLIRGPQFTPSQEFHELGHGYRMTKFPGETESDVNLLHVAVMHQAFGKTLDYAFASSRGFQNNPHRTLDNTAAAWMASFTFADQDPMSQVEKQYQLQGHAKFVQIAKDFGWEVLGDYWKSFNEDHENGIDYRAEHGDTDKLLLRLSKSVGVDITPLYHFWGVHPNNANALKIAIAAENLPESVEIYDAIENYRSFLPGNNSEFRTLSSNFWGRQPSSTADDQTEREHAEQWDDASGQIYDEDTAFAINAVIDDLLELYFNGRPGGPLGDFNGDTMVNLGDWEIFLANNMADLSALTPEEAALLGDMDGNNTNDEHDFVLFQDAYEL